MTDKIKCDKCGLNYQDKICPGCNMAFRTNQVKQSFCTFLCYSADYRVKNPKRKHKAGLVKPAISESQTAAAERMKKKAEGKGVGENG